MARKVNAKIATRAARLRLAPRRKPYHFVPVAPGLAVGYRRNVGAGVFVLRGSDGKGGSWSKTIGHADDYRGRQQPGHPDVVAGRREGPRDGTRRRRCGRPAGDGRRSRRSVQAGSCCA